MSFKAFNQGCNIVAFEKNNKKYGMCCAWAQMVDYDKITLLLGSQSITGKNISKGDILGVCALAKGQEKIALHFGESHSNEVDKFIGINYKIKQNAILIENTKNQMVCEVLEILPVEALKGDHFLLLKINDYSDTNQDFLNLTDVE